MAAVRLDDHETVLGTDRRQTAQQRECHRVQASEDGGVFHQPGAQPAYGLPPEHGRGGERTDERGAQADGAPELQGQRQSHRRARRRSVPGLEVSEVQAEDPGHHRGPGLAAPARSEGGSAEERSYGDHRGGYYQPYGFGLSPP